MGIQPIDLQVMYSQSANVSKLAGSQQAAQLSEAMQQTKTVQQNLENAEKVHQTTDDKAKSTAVNDKGGGNSPQGGNQRKSDTTGGEEQKEEINPFSKLKESYLGTIIDITR